MNHVGKVREWRPREGGYKIDRVCVRGPCDVLYSSETMDTNREITAATR